MSLLDETWEPNFLVERLMELDEILKVTKRFIAQAPDDEALKVSLRQDEAHRKQVVECLQRSLVAGRQHTLSYIFKEHEPGAILLDTLLSGLGAFNNLIEQTFEKLGKSAVPLSYATNFAGSYGVLLSTPSDPQLIGTDYEQGLGKVFDTLSRICEQGSEVHEAIKDQVDDRKLMNRYKRFFQSISFAGKPVELRWTDHLAQERQVYFPVERARQLSNSFSAFTTSEPKELDFSGVVKGVSLLSFKMEFETKEKRRRVIKAGFDPSLAKIIMENLDCHVVAKFQLTTELNEVTEQDQKKWVLLNISV